MSLPPEQINIKRRREEEPVDTLYIQSELHQTKRRFTDFVFQRVTVNARGAPENGSPSPGRLGPAHRAIQSPRSVSSIHLPKSTNRGNESVVPSVRATSPGAELREAKRLATARKEMDSKLKNALHSSPTRPQPEREKLTPVSKKSDVASSSGGLGSSASSGRGSPASSGLASSIRRFQISRTSTPTGPLRNAGSGVQKRRADGAVAILVEKLRREPHSRRASMVADAAARIEASASVADEPVSAPARKRPVVNQAEKKWRAERQGAISAAKDRIAEVLEKGAQARQSNWDDESDRLARQFEQIALELDSEMDVAPTSAKQYPTPSASRPVLPKPRLKYQPRTPNKHRAAAPSISTESGKQKSVESPEDGDSDEDYVYDTYIRHPLPDKGHLTDPLVDIVGDQEAWLRHHGIDSSRQDVGVIVITPEDEAYWEDFAEDTDDEDRWDSEDGDSNAENNPANDYPDEELSWDDEEDDEAAAYRKYRHGHSDDEEFDWDDSGSEAASADRYGKRYGWSHVESDEEW
ncbi:Iwr1 domain-containing protein [Aspergillus stella-maris]|uniref:Iwr1 domain-containing protein n=1 Tax=Aspergillus stella-maris TaxID=1810926 RepID=UPI003CCD9E30